MKLLIISHTAHYINENNEIVGWGPTITEVNHLVKIFDKIYHLAYLHTGNPPPSSLPYNSSKIEFVPLEPKGGKNLDSKLNHFKNLNIFFNKIKYYLDMVDIFQFRAPTGMGVYLIPYLNYKNKKGWYKYAGNWIEKNPPLAYRLQRAMLKKQERLVTVNGYWPNDRENILAFENPCLTELDRSLGKKVIDKKTKSKIINICFVGNLTRKKGFDLFVAAIKNLKYPNLRIHVLGDGILREKYEETKNIRFYGFQPKQKVFEIYSISQFIVLPSLSEGFPKVVAEAMNFGCIPIVSDISGIKQYIINEQNGFLIRFIKLGNLIEVMKKAIEMDDKEFIEMINRNYDISQKFTYEAYIKKLEGHILKNHIE